MTVINIKPMPEAYRKIKKFRPGPPPVFTDVPPAGLARADIELALELFQILDAESKEFYGGERFQNALKERLKTKKINKENEI